MRALSTIWSSAVAKPLGYLMNRQQSKGAHPLKNGPEDHNASGY